LSNADLAYTKDVLNAPGPGLGGVDMNYVRTRIIAKPGIMDLAMANQLRDRTDVTQITTYYDGLGRPVQTVAWQASPMGKDIVNIHAYDPYGREITTYLPYVDTANDGERKINCLTDQYHFNSSQFPDEQFYYGQTQYEASPLNRPLNVYAAGVTWVGSGRGSGSEYLVNNTDDSVRIWTIAAAGSIPQSVAVSNLDVF
jgi:hypothetical protein